MKNQIKIISGIIALFIAIYCINKYLITKTNIFMYSMLILFILFLNLTIKTICKKSKVSHKTKKFKKNIHTINQNKMKTFKNDFTKNHLDAIWNEIEK